MSILSTKHFIGLENATKKDIETLIDFGYMFKEVLDRPIKKVPSLTGVNIANLFFENSTRTKLSFELAEKRLSADVTNFAASSSSLNKGETFKDTVQNIAKKIVRGPITISSIGPLSNLENIDKIQNRLN